jgi:hypothetical protein
MKANSQCPTATNPSNTSPGNTYPDTTWSEHYNGVVVQMQVRSARAVAGCEVGMVAQSITTIINKILNIWPSKKKVTCPRNT